MYPFSPSCLLLGMKFSCKRRRIGHSRNLHKRLCSKLGYHAVSDLSTQCKNCNKTAVTCSVVQKLGMPYHPFCKSLQQNGSPVCLPSCSYFWIDVHRCGMRGPHVYVPERVSQFRSKLSIASLLLPEVRRSFAPLEDICSLL